MQKRLFILCLGFLGLVWAESLFASELYEALWQSFPPATAQKASITLMSEALVAGMLLIMQFFTLSLYLQHRENHGEGWLFVFSILAFVRLLAAGELARSSALAELMPAHWSLRLEFATLALVPMCLLAFTRQSLKLSTKRVSLPAAIIALIYALLSLMTAAPTASIWRFFGFTLALIAGALILIMHGEALRERRAGALLSVLGFLAFLAAEILDALEHSSSRAYGLAFLLLAQGQMMARLFLQGSEQAAAPLAPSAETKEQGQQEMRERDIVAEIAATSHETFCVYMSSLSRMLDDADRVVHAAMERETEVMRRLFLILNTAKDAAAQIGLTTISRQLEDLEGNCILLIKNSRSYWNSVHLHTEIEGVRRLLRLYLRLNSEKLGRSIESIADLLVETKYLNAHQPVLSRAEEKLPELERARLHAERAFAETAIAPLPLVLEDILQQSQRQASLFCDLQIRCRTSILVPFETQRLIRVLFDEITRNTLQHGFNGERWKQPKPTLELDVTLDGDFVRMAIRDSGRGLSIAELRHQGQRSGLVSHGMTAQNLAELLLNTNYKQEKRGLLRLQRLLAQQGGQIRVELLSEIPQGHTHPFLIIVRLPFSAFIREQAAS